MSYIADELVKQTSYKEDHFIRNFFIVMSVLLAAYFIQDTLYGKNSLQVYLSLKKEHKNFMKDINVIEHENANLQKEYFELKSLMPEPLEVQK